MQNIKVGRYEKPVDYAGWIEPEDRSWIAFIDMRGRATFFLERDETGAIVRRNEDGEIISPPPQ
jgi:hypothetical protein